jgi:predicted transcriptional regulator
MATVTVSFTLDDQVDREIVQWLARLPKRQKSAAIREVLRGHLREQGVTLSDIYQAVREVDRKLATGAVVVEVNEVGDTTSADEPPDVAAALDSLGL